MLVFVVVVCFSKVKQYLTKLCAEILKKYLRIKLMLMVLLNPCLAESLLLESLSYQHAIK